MQLLVFIRPVVMLVVGIVLISLLLFYLVTHPDRLLLEQTPEDRGLRAESVQLTTRDGTHIAAWHIPSQNAPKRVLILLHGYPAEKADLLGFAQEFYPEFSIFLLDFRYFGESGGNTSALGLKETQEVVSALDFLTRYGYEKIGVFGYSYGGAIALTTAAFDPRIDAVASYSTYADLKTLAYDAYRFLWILKYPIVELMNLWARIFFGVWPHEVSPLHMVTRINSPVFIGHAEADPVVPVSHAHQLIEALKEGGNTPKTSISEHDTHMGLPADFEKQLHEFFTAHLAQ